MLIIAIMIPAIAFMFLGFAIYITKKDEAKAKKKKNSKINKDKDKDEYKQDEFDKKIKSNKLKQLMDIKEIRNNKIYLKSGAIRVVLSISSPDFELLTDSEQTTFENCLIMSALSLNSPIEFYTTLKKIEIKDPVEDVERVINSTDEFITEGLKNYCSQLYVAYKKIAEDKGVYVRKSFCTIGAYLPDKAEDKILNELQSRVDNIAGGLSRANMRVNLLNSEQLAQLYCDIFNHNKGIQIEKMIKDGAFDLYSEGVGQIEEVDKSK